MNKIQLNIEEIKEIIPHRYPMLLVDKIIDLEEGKGATGIKVVSANETFFQGHFPDYHIMPGVLILEALAQVGAVALLSQEENRGKLALFGGIKNAKFKRQVRPGDTLVLETKLIRQKGPIGIAEARATVDGDLAASGQLTFAIK